MGPNKFRRQANRGEAIVLFGEGEERRDHVDVDDIAERSSACVLERRSAGTLNIATGDGCEFPRRRRQGGRTVAAQGRDQSSPRKGPMPHNGYRPFDPAATLKRFRDFRYTPIDDGLARAQQQEFG